MSPKAREPLLRQTKSQVPEEVSREAKSPVWRCCVFRTDGSEKRLSKKEAQLSKCVAPVRRERGKSKLLSISLFDFSPSLSFISSGRTYGLLMIKHYRGNFKAVSNSNFLYL